MLERRVSKKIKLMDHDATKLIQCPSDSDFQEKSILDLQPMRLGFYGGLFQSKAVAFFGSQELRYEDVQKIQVSIDQLRQNCKIDKIVVNIERYSSLRVSFSIHFIAKDGRFLGVAENQTLFQVEQWKRQGFQKKE